AREQRARLSDFADRELVVVVFFGTEDPLVRIYAPRIKALAAQYSAAGVTFLGVDATEGGASDDLAGFRDRATICFPLFNDPEGAVAGQFGATPQLEVFVLDHCRNVRYHGRVDDQYASEIPRTEPERDDLKEALEDLLSGNSELATPQTEIGAFVTSDSPPPTAAPLLSDSIGERVDEGGTLCSPADVSDAKPGAVSQEG